MTRKKQPTKPNPAHLVIDERFVTEADRRKAAAENFTDADMESLSATISARAMSQPEVRAASIIQEFQGDDLNINSLVDEMREQVAEVQTGSLKRPVAMLITQAHTLDALFSYLARRSHSNSVAGYTDAAEKYLRLALKAQSQTVRTIEALNEIKNPRAIAFVQQANIANGPQQVNNGEPRARENVINANELSGDCYELLPDARASQAASRVNPEVETVGAIHRPANRRRKGD